RPSATLFPYTTLFRSEPLLIVADELRSPEAVTPQAVALAARLVWDSASPLYATSGVTVEQWADAVIRAAARPRPARRSGARTGRSEEHTSELQSPCNL